MRGSLSSQIEEEMEHTWNSAGTLAAHFLLNLLGSTSRMHILRVWRLGYNTIQFVGCN